MTKCFQLLSATLVALAMTVPAQGNNQLTVFDGDWNTNTVPINMVYLDEVGTHSQVIYPAADLSAMTNEAINSMKFYLSEPLTVSGGQIVISVGETTQSTFAGSTYVTGLTPVATIAMVQGATEIEITFDAPYLYHGGNLVFDSQVAQVASDYCMVSFYGDRPSTYTAITRNEIERFLPKTTFDYGSNAEYEAKVLPGSVTFNTIRAEREDIQTIVLTNTGLNAITPTCSVDAPFAVELPQATLASRASLEIPVKFAPQAAGTYNGTLTIDCGPAGTLQVSLNGTAIEAASEVTAGDQTDYASYVPIYGIDIDVVDTRGQMIYPADMLSDMAGGKIIALKFYTRGNVQMNGGVIQMSLREVEDTEFAKNIPFTDLTVVGTLSPVLGSTDLEFIFDEPYAYNGGNLLVECLVTQAGISNNLPTYFYGTPTIDEEYFNDKNVAIYTSFDYDQMETYFVPFMPMATFSYQKEEGPVYQPGDLNKDGIINITDVTLLVNYVLNSSADMPDTADVNGDGNVNISDVTLLISMVMNN